MAWLRDFIARFRWSRLQHRFAFMTGRGRAYTAAQIAEIEHRNRMRL